MYMTPPRRRTPDIRRARPDRRYHLRRSYEERRKPPVNAPFNPVVDVFRVMEAWSGAGHGWTAELVDEEDLDGLVVIKDENGTPMMYMPRDVYEGLLDT